MRSVAIVALATLSLLALSGCTTPSNETAEPGPGAPVGPPQPPGNPPSSPPSTPGSPPPSFAPQSGHDSTNSTDAPGIHVEGSFEMCDEGFCANVTAFNEGPATYHISSICVPPWMDSMTHEGEAVRHHDGGVYCAAFGTRPFAPGERIWTDFTWDQRVWDEDGSPGPAPEGSYEWTVTLQVMDDSDGAERHDISLQFQLFVGPT